MRKGFNPQNSGVGNFYIEEGIAELKVLSEKLPSLKSYQVKVEKFVMKHIEFTNGER